MSTLRILSLLTMALALGNPFSGQAARGQVGTPRDLFADTWVAVDGLGRRMPMAEEVGLPKGDHRRVVGIFYVTWHGDSAAAKPSPYRSDVSRILADSPAARLDGNDPAWIDSSYHWGEPEMGYFLSKDLWVIRNDLSMLADAGVDVLILDVTNGVRYWEEWDALFQVMHDMHQAGNPVPRFCFWSFNGPGITVVEELYDRIYLAGKHREFWFEWDGKPLLLYNARPSIDANGADRRHPNPRYLAEAAADPNHPQHADPRVTMPFLMDYSADVRQFFTLRNMWWGYYEWAGQRHVGTEDNWSFGYDLGDARVRGLRPDELVSRHGGIPEQAAVTPAQHASTGIGKSWSRAKGQPALDDRDLPRETIVPWSGQTVQHPEGYGIYFQERWDEALAADPQFIYLNDWNEWTAGKYPPPHGQTVPFLGRPSNFFFVDQYNAEFNRAIQPMRGGYADNYYMQMVQNIRRYKGASKLPAQTNITDIQIDGDTEDWRGVAVEYRDTIGDTTHRDYPGYGGLRYHNDSGRNDIVACQVATDSDNLFFKVTTREPLSPSSDPNWMLLLIDVDRDPGSGWYGYDLLVNREVKGGGETSVHRFVPDDGPGSWEICDSGRYAVRDRVLEIALPATLFAVRDGRAWFDFHWCDNPRQLTSPIDLCTHGDSAPNRRFNYRYE